MKTRLQFDFANEALDELDALKVLTGASTRAAVIRQSLRLLQWVLQDVKMILVERGGVQREVMLPFLRSTDRVEKHPEP